jgi:hypothetical protein
MASPGKKLGTQPFNQKCLAYLFNIANLLESKSQMVGTSKAFRKKSGIRGGLKKSKYMDKNECK